MAINLDEKDLENALRKDESKAGAGAGAPEMEMSKEEEIGFHKGSLNTLAAERNELVKMVGNVEAIMQAHIKRLEELGVKIQSDKK
ncbi:hypothetical protein GOV12_00910 [Candidatus Pacearchaeota archaeon]|nr:hypothetical protein [Candidatus Pacearchaeota archaeon]